MSHSVVKDFPTQTDRTLIVVVNENGEVSVDKETLDGYAKLGNSQVSILRVENDDGATVEMTLDTFHETDTTPEMEALTVNVEEDEDELTRNYNNFRMDHCYTPLTSPSQQKPPIPPDLDSELELDDLAQTLSMLDGSEKANESSPQAKPVTNTVKFQQKLIEKEHRTDTANDKVQILNKVNKMGVHKVYKGVKTVVKGATKVFKKIEQPHFESDPDDDDDLNDSDFELNESPHRIKSKRTYRRRSKLENSEMNNEMRNKVVKIRKGVKQIVYKPHSPTKTVPPPPEVKVEPTPPPPVTPEPIKSPEIKKFPKKEKKIPKVVDDGIALFSTPDIIRRVGSGKPGEKVAESPESPNKILKPAKIEDRSKSETGRLSTDSKTKSPHRHSLDSKLEKSKSETKHTERRASNASDKASDNTTQSNTFDNNVIENNAVPVTSNIPVENHDETFDNISEAVGNMENPIDPAPSAEMIRSIIHTSDTKTFSTPMETQNIETPIINTVAPNVDQSQLNLEGTGLDIDQGILDNINADELIPEDILYQVAKLVENPDVQNVIDRTLVDANISLDSAIQPQISQQQTPTPAVQQQSSQPQTAIVVSSSQSSVPSLQNQHVTKNTTQRPIQIVRSDGRVVILPPIEKPATRSSKKKQEPSPQQPQIQQPPKPQVQLEQQIPHPIITQPKVHHARPLHKQTLGIEEIQEEAGGSDIESDSDESWNSEDDPDRLWCICKQPHNNRFMICCDTCEDWFHGKCVNVTKAMGQQMEQQGKEWMCPNCVKKTNSPSVTTSQPVPNQLINKAAKVPTDAIVKRKSTDSGPPCIVCGAPSRANSVYCSDTCILKHAQGVEKETNKAQKNVNQRIIVFERSTGKCLSGPNAPTAANLKQWLREHPGFEVVRPINKTKQSLVQSKLQVVKNPQGKEGVGLAVNRKGIQVGVLPHSSKQQQQPNTIKLIPATKLNVPGAKTQIPKQINQTSPIKPVKTLQTIIKSPLGSTLLNPPKPKPTTPTTSKVEKTPRERKQKLLTNQTTDTPKANAQENIRDTVKKTLNEQLTTRLKEVEDIKLTEDEVDKLATDIEIQLYKLFGDSGPKYRTKYRSLIFNIKDTKNQTLWRRICEKTIAPAQLVRLTPDEMASQELARWRERENKHQLDMIKKSELEMLSINRTYVLKTHKGEQVMEDRPSVKVDSTEIMPGLGADSTSEQESGTGDKSEKDEHGSDKKSSKHNRRDRDRDKRSSKDRSSSKDRRNSKEHKSSRSKRSRSREKDRDRSSHRSERKRSRSRDRHHRSSHKSSRHRRDKHSTEHLDKKSREILDNLENNKIVPPPEDRLWKHVTQQDILVATPDSDSDHEPTSTVTIPTPPRSLDQEESQNQAAKQTDPTASSETTEKSEQKTDISAKSTRADPRLTREASIDTPKSESPQQPTTPNVSTSPVPPAQAKYTSESKETIIWEGIINMADVAKIFITLHEVSGDCSGLGTELPSTLEVVGRISPDTVWEYIGKMRRSNSKLISVLRLTARDIEERMPYIALYSYLNSRSRFGVIKSTNSAVKDFYIMPLASHAPVPQALLPLSGPGFEESRPHLLLGIIVRAKRKRPNPMDIVSNPTTKRSRLDSPSVPVGGSQPPRSYTPPPTRDPRIRLPTVPSAPVNNDDDEPYSPEDSDLELNTPVARKTSTKVASSVVGAAATALTIKPELTSLVTTTSLKSNTFLDTATVQSFEPFSNKFDSIPGLDDDTGVDSLAKKMAELDKCIAKQKEEIRSISENIVSSGATIATNLNNISLPSNLQQILDSIKNIPSTSTGSQDASTEEYCPTAPGFKTSSSEELTIPLLLPKLSSRQSTVRTTTPQLPVSTDSKPIQMTSTIPLQLPVAPRESTPVAADLALPNLTVPPPTIASVSTPTLPLPNTNIPPPVVLPNLNVPPPTNIIPSSNSTIPLNLPKSKPKSIPAAPVIAPVVPPVVVPLTPPGTAPVVIPPIVENKSVDPKPASVLSSLSEEELIRKAAEMLGEAEPAPEEEVEDRGKAADKGFQTQNAFKSAPIMYSPTPVVPNPPKRTKLDVSQPPVPGLEDEY